MGRFFGRRAASDGEVPKPPPAQVSRAEPLRDPGPAKTVFEFMIHRTDGEWFDIMADKMPEVLRPLTIPSTNIRGWGDNRVQISPGVVSFSYEDPGIQVSMEDFQGSEADAEAVAADILANIEKTTGQKGRIVRIT